MPEKIVEVAEKYIDATSTASYERNWQHIEAALIAKYATKFREVLEIEKSIYVLWVWSWLAFIQRVNEVFAKPMNKSIEELRQTNFFQWLTINLVDKSNYYLTRGKDLIQEKLWIESKYINKIEEDFTSDDFLDWLPAYGWLFLMLWKTAANQSKADLRKMVEKMQYNVERYYPRWPYLAERWFFFDVPNWNFEQVEWKEEDPKEDNGYTNRVTEEWFETAAASQIWNYELVKNYFDWFVQYYEPDAGRDLPWRIVGGIKPKEGTSESIEIPYTCKDECIIVQPDEIVPMLISNHYQPEDVISLLEKEVDGSKIDGFRKDEISIKTHESLTWYFIKIPKQEEIRTFIKKIQSREPIMRFIEKAQPFASPIIVFLLWVLIILFLETDKSYQSSAKSETRDELLLTLEYCSSRSFPDIYDDFVVQIDWRPYYILDNSYLFQVYRDFIYQSIKKHNDFGFTLDLPWTAKEKVVANFFTFVGEMWSNWCEVISYYVNQRVDSDHQPNVSYERSIMEAWRDYNKNFIPLPWTVSPKWEGSL